MSAYYYGMYNSITAMTSVIVPVVVIMSILVQTGVGIGTIVFSLNSRNNK